jgi:hypothetical protein
MQAEISQLKAAEGRRVQDSSEHTLVRNSARTRVPAAAPANRGSGDDAEHAGSTEPPESDLHCGYISRSFTSELVED